MRIYDKDMKLRNTFKTEGTPTDVILYDEQTKGSAVCKYHRNGILSFSVPFAHLYCGCIFVLKDKYPNFEVGLKCILTVNPYLLVCSYIK